MRQAQEFSHVPVIDVSGPVDGAPGRWTGAVQLGQACRENFFASVHAFEGTYGDYLLNKVGKVFPELRQTAL